MHRFLVPVLACKTGARHRAFLPFDTLRDFASVTKLGDATLILVAYRSVPARDVRELISLKNDFA